jgi:pimeloyl-ACP methyl ester carboxylesterase
MLRYLEAKPPAGVRARGTLLLLHAFPLNARMWEPQLAFAQDGWRVIAPDLTAGNATTTMEDFAGSVVDVLDGLHIEDAVVGGCSMGGYLALALTRLAERYVRGLLLVDTRAQADTPEGIENRKKALQLVNDKGTPAIVEDMIPKLLGETTKRTRPEVVERVRAIGLANSKDAVVGMVRALMTRADSTPLLSKIHVPTLIIVGAEDTITPPAMSEQMHAAIAGSQLVILDGVGHLSSVEDPARFNRTVSTFLEHRL